VNTEYLAQKGAKEKMRSELGERYFFCGMSSAKAAKVTEVLK